MTWLKQNTKFKKGDLVYSMSNNEFSEVTKVFRIKGLKRDFFKYKCEDCYYLIDESDLRAVVEEDI